MPMIKVMATVQNKPAKARAAALSRLQKYERRHREVLDAAASAFAEKGFHGTNTQDIADRLGIRQASLYYYAESKEALLEEVCGIGIEGYLQMAEDIAAGEDHAVEKIRLLVSGHLQPLTERPDHVRVFLNCRAALPEESRHRVGALTRRYEQVITDILAGGVESGALRASLDCRLATLSLLALCNAASGWLAHEEDLAVEKAADEISALFLGGVSR